MDSDEPLQPLPAEVLQEIEALADALIRRLPALSDLSSLIDTARQVSIRGGQVQFAFDELMSLESLERNYIMHVLNAVEFNKARTAEVLGIDPSTLTRPVAVDIRLARSACGHHISRALPIKRFRTPGHLVSTRSSPPLLHVRNPARSVPFFPRTPLGNRQPRPGP